MNGLREVHANKLLHLDIKPANIFISMERTGRCCSTSAPRASRSRKRR